MDTSGREYHCFPKVEQVADYFDKVAGCPPECHDLVIPKIIDGGAMRVPEGECFEFYLKSKGLQRVLPKVGGSVGSLPEIKKKKINH